MFDVAHVAFRDRHYLRRSLKGHTRRGPSKNTFEPCGMPYRGSFAALPALARRWVVSRSWSNATRDGSDSSSGFRVRTPAGSADFDSFAGRRCGLGAQLYSADGSDLEFVSPAILIGLDLSARRRNRGARVKPLCRRMTGLGETSPTTIAPLRGSHRLRMRLRAVPALVDFAAERRKTPSTRTGLQRSHLWWMLRISQAGISTSK
jgi:hypothetical protein